MKEFFGASLNVAISSLFYTGLGGLLSFVMGYIFDDFDQVWKTRSIFYQLLEIGLELSMFGLVAFWVSHVIEGAAPIFPVSDAMDKAVDSYVSGLFFAYAMFLFLDELSSKIKHVYNTLVKPVVAKVIPDGGYLLEGNLHFTRKTDKKKTN